MKTIFIWLLLCLAFTRCDAQLPTLAGYPLPSADNAAPTVIISTSAVSPVGVPITEYMTVSKWPLTGVTSSDITLVNCSISNFTQLTNQQGTPANIWSYLVTPTADGAFSTSVTSNKFTDSGGHNNTASNTLTLTYTSGSFIPSNISPDLWMDMVYQYGFSNSLGQPNTVASPVDQLTSRDASAYTSTAINSGALYRKPSWNGEGYVFNAYQGFDIGTTSSFKKLHGSAAYTFYYQWTQLPTTAQTNSFPIFETNGTTFTNSGIGAKLVYVNSGTTASTVRYAIYNGAGGTVPFDVTCAASSVAVSNSSGVGGMNTLKVTFTGTVLTIYIKNSIHPTYTSIGTQTVGSPALSSSNSANAMRVGYDGLLTSNLDYKKHLCVFFSTVSGGNTTSLETYFTAQESVVTTPTTVPVFLGANHQSNGEGVGVNTDAASDIKYPALLGSYRYRAYASEVAYQNAEPYWGQLELQQHAKSGVPPVTTHGWYARLGFNMNADGHPIYMVFPCRSSTPIAKSTVSWNWSATTPFDQFSYFDNTWKQGVSDGLYELVHCMRKLPELRVLYSYQGESDSGVATQLSYRDEQEALINAMLAYLTGIGYDISKIWYVDTMVTSGATTTLTSVAVTNSSGDALFTKASHGIPNASWVRVTGTTDYDGIKYVVVIDANTFKVRTGSAASNTAYTANKTASVKIYGAVNSGKLDMQDTYSTRFPTQAASFKGLMYVDAAILSTQTHLDAAGYDALGVQIEGKILSHINE